MNANLQRLINISQKPERRILGLMSGTSLDGLDLALCRIKGTGVSTEAKVEYFRSYAYSEAQKAKLRKVVSREQASLSQITLLNAWLGDLFAQIIQETLAKWEVNPQTVDCIASHGHTVYHAPKRLHAQEGFPDATLQLADGDRIAHKTGIITLHDFRQKHLAAGGEGAPLAVYGDYLLFANPEENRCLLNVGGIANCTFLPKSSEGGQVIASDLGAGNCLMDGVMRKFFGKSYDAQGLLARSGKRSESLLNTLKSLPFFAEAFPKTTGLELFNEQLLKNAQIESDTEFLSGEDLLATLNYFTAWGIGQGIRAIAPTAATVIVSGGGVHNDFLLENIQKQLPKEFSMTSSQDYQINPDAKEALLFALLANETLAGEPMAVAGLAAISLGKISLPY